MKVAVITAIFGNYESSLKTPAKQTVDTDYYCFTDNANIIASDDWKIITEPYHVTHNEDDNYLNSLRTNKHTFMIAKYYKCHFNKIPILNNYDIVIWIDGTIKITDPKCIETCINIINEGHSVITMDHDWRNGKMINEVTDSMYMGDYYKGGKYNSKFWANQWQPYQDVDAHYKRMLADGYTDNWWIKHNTLQRGEHYGVFVTCFIAFNMRDEKITKFLEDWYMIIKKESHQDQVAFSQSLFINTILPYGLPDNLNVSGKFNNNTFFMKLNHGM